MKTVLFLTRKLQTQSGGMQTQTRSLLEALRRSSDVHVHVVGYSGGVLGIPFYCLQALFVALRTSADTVHAGDALLSCLFPVLAFFRPSLRRTVTVHGLDLVWHAFGYRSCIRFSLQYADHVVAVSHGTARLVRECGVADDKVSIIPCSVSLPELKFEKRAPVQLLLLSRLVERKGTLWFLQAAFPLLQKTLPDVHIVIAGDGPEMQNIRTYVAQRHWSTFVTLLGEVSEGKKNALLRESTLLVVPNIQTKGNPEGFGIVCIEAAASGLPTIAARIEGLVDAVEERVTGMFFTSGSAEDLVRVIQSALKTEWSPETMRDMVQIRFDPDRIAARYIHDVF